MAWKGHGQQRVRLDITARRVRIDPRKKRRSYIKRLEKRKSREELRTEIERIKRGLEAESEKAPEDPVEFCMEWLGFEPFRYMWPFLRDPSHFVANV